MHQVVETHAVLQEVIDAPEDAEYAEGEDPNPDDCDNRRLPTDKPAEETEKSGNNINNQNGAGELPRWDR